MLQIHCKKLVFALWAIMATCWTNTGCLNHECLVPPGHQLPVELNKVSHPDYVIEPPDILLVNAVQAVPIPPYKVQPLDQLLIQVPGALPTSPIDGIFGVEPDGMINLGLPYGKIRVVGMTVDQIKATIEEHLKKNPAGGLKNPQTSVSLAQTQSMQEISGEHLVRMDGTISLGTYGKVYVTGLTIEEATKAVEQHLAQFLLKPVISMDILAYNSKVCYVVLDQAGFVQVFRLPITGNETVLDALSSIQGALTGVSGLPPGTSRKRIWVARPAPPGACGEQILPVDWCAITEGGKTATNYQLFPGDRVCVKPDPWIEFDNALAKVLTPFERIFGFTLLGNATVRALGGQSGGTGGAGTGGGFGF